MDTQPKKTILITAPYFPPHSGGLERYAYEVSKRLRTSFDWNVVVLTSGEKQKWDNIEEMNGVTIHRLGYAFKLSNTPFSFRWFFKVRRLIKEINPDVINIHTPVPGIGEVAAVCSGKRPVVVTYHAGSMKKDVLLPDILVWVYEKVLLRYLLFRAERIICSSDFVRQGLLKKWSDKSVTITPAVDSEVFTPRTEKRSENPTLLFVAGLGEAERYKGLKTLIDAVKLLRVMIPDIRLTVVGDGDRRSYYQEYVKELKLEEQVVFKGSCFGDDLIAAYQEAHVFVLPTSNDSSPMVITEAMAAGLPVVSTYTGGIPDIVDDGATGFLLEPNDPEHLAQMIGRIIMDPVCAARFGVAGRKKALDRYSWQDRVHAYSSVLVRVLAKENTIVQVSAYFPPHLGGIEQVAASASKRLAKSGKRVLVITTKNKELNEFSPSNENLSIRTVPFFEITNIPIAPLLLWELFRIPKKSIIHFHLSQAFWPETVLLMSGLRGIPYVAHFHLDIEPSSSFGPLFRIYKKMVWGPFLRKAEQVVVCSPEQIKIVVQKYKVIEQKVSVVPNAVDDAFYIDRIYTPDTRELKLLYVGRLAVQKRVERIIEAISLMTVPVHLTLAGDGDEREALEAMVKEKKLKNVEFLGMQNQENLKDLYQSHDMLVISSDREGMPLVVLEAMAGGLPVIGTNVIGIRELVKGAGVLVDAPYGEQFAEAITDLSKRPEKLQELSKQSRERARLYTWNSVIEKLYATYNEIRA